MCGFPKDGGEEEEEEEEEEREGEKPPHSSPSLPSPNPTPGTLHTLSIDPCLSLSLSLLCDSLSVSLYSLSFACLSMLLERYMERRSKKSDSH